MRPVYLLLTRTRTLPSRLIHAATGDGFTHVSIALDRELEELYSFARRRPRLPLPAGLVRESLHTAVYARSGRAHCALYRLDLAPAQYDAIRARIEAMMAAAEPYRYSILGVLLCKMDLAHQRSRHMFCSQFVAGLLEDVGVAGLPKPPSLMHPVDFLALPGLRRCYEGPLSGVAGWWREKARPPRAIQGIPVYTGAGGEGIAGTYTHRG